MRRCVYTVARANMPFSLASCHLVLGTHLCQLLRRHSSSKFLGGNSTENKKQCESLRATASAEMTGSDTSGAPSTKKNVTEQPSTFMSASEVTSVHAPKETRDAQCARSSKTQRHSHSRREKRMLNDVRTEVRHQKSPKSVSTGNEGRHRNSSSENDAQIRRDRLSEREDMFKLLMFSDALGFMFSTLPSDRRRIYKYLKKVDQAVIPTHTEERPLDLVSEEGKGGKRSKSRKIVQQQDASLAKRGIAQRLLSEDSADNTICIEVRDMEQLRPPLALLRKLKNEEASSAKSERGRQRGRGKRSEKTEQVGGGTVGKGPAPSVPAEHVLALQRWQMEALRRSKESQERYKTSSDCHFMTRVRFRDPLMSDVTALLDCNSGKTVNDILDILMRKYKKWFRRHGAIRFNKSDATSTKADETAVPPLPSTPFVMNPLLSVFASCIPRREATLGGHFEERIFLRASSSSVSQRRARRTGSACAASDTEAEATTPSNNESLSGWRLPSMPRFTTRVVVLVEYDDMRSGEGRVSENEGSGDTLAQRQRREPHIYCLITDGGEL
uniref:Uncharacterized protein n=1 Tax=Trypanosoma vivax (strain Y486) TaxID=1055687 RepID=G0TUH7_TRYVY|nr:conserved hypothetical protein [Trypanosoma vivax Y486]